MSNSIQQFNFHSHIIRVEIDEDGNPWFMAKDVCVILGYSNDRDAISRHCQAKGVVKRDTLTDGGVQMVSFINEGNLYRLIIKSNKPEAEPFESWVCDEVLPSIRKHGYYISPEIAVPDLDEVTGNLPFQRLNTAKYDSLRKTSRALAQAYLMECGITPDYVQQQVGQLSDHASVFGGKCAQDLRPLVSRFVSNWQSGALNAPFSHCLGSQALRLFHLWADYSGLTLRQGDNHIMAALYQHPDLYGKRVHIERGRYISAKKMLMIDGLKPPANVYFVDWLAGCVVAMEAALKLLEVN